MQEKVDSTSFIVNISMTINILVQMIFIGLKFLGIVSWSWFWVLFPSVLLVGFIVLTILAVIVILVLSLALNFRGGITHDKSKN